MTVILSTGIFQEPFKWIDKKIRMLGKRFLNG